MRLHGLGRIAAAMLTVAGLAAPLSAQNITDADLAKGLTDPNRWLVVSGTYDGQRLSPLTQITPANASQLAPQWTFQAGVTGQFEATPVVLDGTLYVTGPQSHAWAIDGRTGFAGGHEQAVIAVLNRQYDAGVAWTSGIGDPAEGYSRGALRMMVEKKMLDMKDLRAMLQHVGENAKSYQTEYGTISAAWLLGFGMKVDLSALLESERWKCSSVLL